MKREWFEPGLDGVSPLVREYNKSRGTAGEAISAAFRALLAEDAAQHDERDALINQLLAEVERLKSECSEQQRYVLDLESAISRKETRIKVLEVANDSLTHYSSNLTAERDALQARIDAGVRVWGDHLVWGQLEEHDTHTGIVIDVEKIRPDVVEMVDERKTPGTRADRRPA